MTALALGRTAWAAAALDLQRLRRDWVFVVLTVLAAVSLLVLVSLFSLTGSNAPLAVVDEDGTEVSRQFVHAVGGVPHAFVVRPMDARAARDALRSGRLVGIMTIPAGFAAQVQRGETVAVDVDVDNVNEDLIFDLERALPSAILDFGHAAGFPGLRAKLVEHDLLPKDVPFLQYLAASTLGLIAFVIAAALAGLAIAREWEEKTLKLLLLSPARGGAVLLGKLLATGAVSAVAVLAAAAAVVIGYGVVPVSPLGVVGVLLVCVVLFTSIGAWIGALCRRTLPVVPLVFGLAMPLFIDSGALEPTRFDGDTIWWISHLSPLYYGSGALAWAFFGIRITPEPVSFDVAVLVALALVSVLAAARMMARATSRTRGWR
jgi:ABC-2 type transport system permease protein